MKGTCSASVGVDQNIHLPRHQTFQTFVSFLLQTSPPPHDKMDLTARVRALPTELFDQVFQHVLVGGEPRAQYTRPVPRPKATLRCLVAYINEMLRVNNRGINFADAALCIARLFDIFDLYKSISYVTMKGRRHISWHVHQCLSIHPTASFV